MFGTRTNLIGGWIDRILTGKMKGYVMHLEDFGMVFQPAGASTDGGREVGGAPMS